MNKLVWSLAAIGTITAAFWAYEIINVAAARIANSIDTKGLR